MMWSMRSPDGLPAWVAAKLGAIVHEGEWFGWDEPAPGYGAPAEAWHNGAPAALVISAARVIADADPTRPGGTRRLIRLDALARKLNAALSPWLSDGLDAVVDTVTVGHSRTGRRQLLACGQTAPAESSCRPLASLSAREGPAPPLPLIDAPATSPQAAHAPPSLVGATPLRSTRAQFLHTFGTQSGGRAAPD